MRDDSLIKGARVIGYVRVDNRDQLYLTSQDSVLEKYANKELLDMVQIEHDVSNGSQIMRLGLWKTLRMMLCINCEPRQMPMNLDYESWIKEVMRPCTSCKAADQLKGIVVVDVSKVCTQPAQGAKFTLDMCAARKHLYSVQEGRCISCCNPQAVEFLRKRMTKEEF